MNASSKLICFDMHQNKILWRSSFKTQLEDLSFLCRLTDIKIAWINHCKCDDGCSTMIWVAFSDCLEKKLNVKGSHIFTFSFCWRVLHLFENMIYTSFNRTTCVFTLIPYTFCFWHFLKLLWSVEFCCYISS